MKKAKLILTMATMAGMVVFTGCNAKLSVENSGNDENNGAQTIVIETSMEAECESQSFDNEAETADGEEAFFQTESGSNIFAEVDENWKYVLVENEEYAYLFEVKYDETTYKEYATIICQGEKGAYWTYETDKYEVGQCCAVEILESPVEYIYLNEGGTITALDITNGNVLWQNSDYQGSGSVCTMDESDNLYVAGFDSPALIVIDKNGNTLHRVGQFGDYFWPYEMFVEDNMLTIYFDSDEDAKVVMDIRDYSYTIY